MSGKIKVLVVEPEKSCKVREVEDELEALQAIVGGHIEIVTQFAEPVAIMCNESGKMLGLPFNRPLVDQQGMPYDILCGTFFIAGVQGENFASLTDAQISRYQNLYDNMMVVPDEKDKNIGRIVSHPKPARQKNGPER